MFRFILKYLKMFDKNPRQSEERLKEEAAERLGLQTKDVNIDELVL
jgi:hypothetical protein